MKITKKDLFADLRELAEDAERADLIEFIDHEIELLNNKSTSKKPTKTQKENETLKENIIEALKNAGKPMTISELIMGAPKLSTQPNGNPMTTQKMSSMMTLLEKENLVIRTKDKKRTEFTLA